MPNPYIPEIVRIALLDNGALVEYDIEFDRPDAEQDYAVKLLGYGVIHSINYVIQEPGGEKMWFYRREKAKVK